MFDIPTIKQKGNFMCIPACVEMALRFLDKSIEVNQHDIMKQQWMNKEGYVPKDYQERRDSGISFDNIKKILDELKIKREVIFIKGKEEGKSPAIILESVKEILELKHVPVLISLKKTYNTCHIVLITGINSENFYYNDPEKNVKEQKNIFYFIDNLADDMHYMYIT